MNIIFIAIISIIIFDYILEQLLEYLNSTKRGDKLPPELSNVFNEDEYIKQQEYEKTSGKFGYITSTFSLIVMLLMLFFNGFASIDTIARSITDNTVFITLIFFAILMFASDIINTPFSIYNTFVIEERFGFNKTTIKTFILDKIKGLFLGGIIGGILLSAIVIFYNFTGNLFWLYAWGLISFFIIFITMFYSSLIVPLFNKQTKLEDGDLKSAIHEFSKKVGFKIDNIYKIDGSKRSTKANAYFTGIGMKKRIVLYDTLINDLSTKEIVAVLAHEIGHYKKKHTITTIVISILQIGLTLYILSLFVGNPALSKALGVNEPSFHIGLIAFGILYSPISTIIGLVMNIISRKNEYEADIFAKYNFSGEYLISALKKLSKNSLSNLNPHPAYVFFHYSHPTLLQRIINLNK